MHILFAYMPECVLSSIVSAPFFSLSLSGLSLPSSSPNYFLHGYYHRNGIMKGTNATHQQHRHTRTARCSATCICAHVRPALAPPTTAWALWGSYDTQLGEHPCVGELYFFHNAMERIERQVIRKAYHLVLWKYVRVHCDRSILRQLTVLFILIAFVAVTSYTIWLWPTSLWSITFSFFSWPSSLPFVCFFLSIFFFFLGFFLCLLCFHRGGLAEQLLGTLSRINGDFTIARHRANSLSSVCLLYLPSLFFFFMHTCIFVSLSFSFHGTCGVCTSPKWLLLLLFLLLVLVLLLLLLMMMMKMVMEWFSYLHLC